MTIKCYVDDGRKVSLLVPLLIAMRQFLSTYMYVLLVDMEPLTLIFLFPEYHITEITKSVL